MDGLDNGRLCSCRYTISPRGVILPSGTSCSSSSPSSCAWGVSRSALDVSHIYACVQVYGVDHVYRERIGHGPRGPGKSRWCSMRQSKELRIGEGCIVIVNVNCCWQGIIMNIPQAVLGLTVLAWGNSLGDMVANVSVARNGDKCTYALYHLPAHLCIYALHQAFAPASCTSVTLLRITVPLGG